MVIGVIGAAVVRRRWARTCEDDAVRGEERDQHQPGNQTSSLRPHAERQPRMNPNQNIFLSDHFIIIGRSPQRHPPFHRGPRGKSLHGRQAGFQHRLRRRGWCLFLIAA